MSANLGVFPTVSEAETFVTSQCPEFYAKDSLILSQYLKLCWWLIINSMWIWVVIPHHLETASYYPTISVTIPTGYTVFNSICVATKQYNFFSMQGVLNPPLI
ncbi:hypothetical protein DSO57_1008665 [Entomophthora muscae]|uniref:Uncharacterized protein n=1 Tax=Entomophthora muscae TaxID=34485 RepID=A0ACC2T7V5_9FUNG|nr:hypothetical protein DSO57_1008665 [Entomophthora muscae]